MNYVIATFLVEIRVSLIVDYVICSMRIKKISASRSLVDYSPLLHTLARRTFGKQVNICYVLEVTCKHFPNGMYRCKYFLVKMTVNSA